MTSEYFAAIAVFWVVVSLKEFGVLPPFRWFGYVAAFLAAGNVAAAIYMLGD